jgi:hypothetical protein
MRAVGGQDRLGVGIGRQRGERPALEAHADGGELGGDPRRVLGHQDLAVRGGVPDGQAALETSCQADRAVARRAVTPALLADRLGCAVPCQMNSRLHAHQRAGHAGHK